MGKDDDKNPAAASRVVYLANNGLKPSLTLKITASSPRSSWTGSRARPTPSATNPMASSPSRS